MSTLVLYHKNCDDGFGAAFSAWRKLGDGAAYMPIDYRDDIPLAQMAGKDVIVIDFCFDPADTYEKILPVVASLTVIDHHKSAVDKWAAALGRQPENGIFKHSEGKFSLYFDLSRSGALLSWGHFHSEMAAPRFIEHLSDIDLWTFTLKDTRAVSNYVRTMSYDFDAWNELCAALENAEARDAIVNTGERITDFYDRQVDQIARSGRDVPIVMTGADGKKATGLAINASKAFASELGHIIAKKSGTFAVIWDTDGKRVNCSMRSVDGFNCIPLAEAQGGGGHPQACGFNAPLENMIAAIRGEKDL